MLGWHLKRGGHLFVDRRHPDRAGILKRWRALVSEGLSLIIYAEGTRSPDGRVARFKAGSFLLAIEAGLPVVPLAVIGTRAVMPKGRLRTEPADVTLVVHDPIPAAGARRADRPRRQGARRPRPRDRARRPSNRGRRSWSTRACDDVYNRRDASISTCMSQPSSRPADAASGSAARVPSSCWPSAAVRFSSAAWRRFSTHPAIDEVVVALPAELVADPPAYLRARRRSRSRLVAGGERRQDSVANAFQRGRRERATSS